MRLTPSDPSSLTSLLDFLRGQGCIAYCVDDTDEIAVMTSSLSGPDEERTIRELVERWRFAYPVVEVTLSER